MKKLLVAGMVVLSLSVQAQKTTTKTGTQKAPAKPKTTTTKPVNPLKNQTDTVSYAIGFMVAKFYKGQGIKKINSAMVAKAVNDVYANKPEIFSETESNNIVMRALNPKLSDNMSESEAFMKQNGKRPEVKTTSTGLQYEVLTEGTGSKPSSLDTVTVHYRGTLVNGNEFDNSYKRGEPISFPLNRVIPGWTEGLQLMSTGGKYKLYVPYQLGYGLGDSGPIPGGSALIFEIELLKVNGKD